MNKNQLYDYNKVFREFDEECERQDIPNAFYNIGFAELMELNDLFDKVLLFCDNISEEELEDIEGADILKLRKLIDELFTSSISRSKNIESLTHEEIELVKSFRKADEKTKAAIMALYNINE